MSAEPENDIPPQLNMPPADRKGKFVSRGEEGHGHLLAHIEASERKDSTVVEYICKYPSMCYLENTDRSHGGKNSGEDGFSSIDSSAPF